MNFCQLCRLFNVALSEIPNNLKIIDVLVYQVPEYSNYKCNVLINFFLPRNFIVTETERERERAKTSSLMHIFENALKPNDIYISYGLNIQKALNFSTLFIYSKSLCCCASNFWFESIKFIKSYKLTNTVSPIGVDMRI